MSQRYFVEQPITSTHVRIAGAEAHHLLHVMRGQRGQMVELFDGSGNEFQAEICGGGRDWVDLSVKSSAAIDRELASALEVAVALPKGDRQRILVEKLVELGVSSLVPLITARGVAQWSDQVRTRLKRCAIEASKQCGRNRLMKIGEPMKCESFFSGDSSYSSKLIAHPGGQPISVIAWSAPVAIAIGPEGGFTNEEFRIAVKNRWQPIHLGPRILRVETAALFVSAIASARMNNEIQSAGAPTPRTQTT